MVTLCEDVSELDELESELLESELDEEESSTVLICLSCFLDIIRESGPELLLLLVQLGTSLRSFEVWLVYLETSLELLRRLALSLFLITLYFWAYFSSSSLSSGDRSSNQLL